MGITYNCDNFWYSSIFDGIESEMLLFLSTLQQMQLNCYVIFQKSNKEEEKKKKKTWIFIIWNLKHEHLLPYKILRDFIFRINASEELPLDKSLILLQ